MHIVLSPGGLGYGAGHYGLAPAALERLRQRICAPGDRKRLLDALAAARSAGSELDPPDLARPPKGYRTEPEWDHLLRRKALIVRTQADLPVPDWLMTADAVPRLAGILQAHLPLLAWLIG